ncbi:pilus assembly protein [Stenotrophomonas sp. STM01]|jgi:hypothetical protein|uniref:TadE/TadG family type IV pilus assembly protein n=1 Tax=Stenotrophomonas sp. STM01 TaxID=2769278 RepID=UPI00178589BF|nr:TadE/TadG family type IV pilus assembly protein [Stenotrophomonas sp. STM01]MBD9535959.1 pilus assembly protein [Stenotrophomonas sp. STM01]
MNTPRLQRGQSMVEMAVLCLVLVPLFLLIPTLGKYVHIRQQAQQATRAAAWEATASRSYAVPSNAQVRPQLIARHFGAADSKIISNVPASTAERLDDPLLNTFSNQPLLQRSDITLGAYRNDREPGIMGRLSGLISKLPGPFPPNERGLITASMDMRIRDLRTADGSAAAYLEPFDTIGLRMQTTSALLADPWNAAGAGISGNNPRSVKAQIRNMVPTSNLEDGAKMLQGVSSLPLFGVLGDLKPGYIEPDVVPMDKLERYAPRP